jgi:hypothetical protein
VISLAEWAARWGVPEQAMRELAGIPAFEPVPSKHPATSESAMQSCIRLEAARAGIYAWRNNVGAGKLENGSFIRWGLANDSEKLNKVIKSADLIGIRKRFITLADVGSIIGQFWSREVKRPGWRYGATPEEQAQLRWCNLIQSNGGDAAIVNSEGSISK